MKIKEVSEITCKGKSEEKDRSWLARALMQQPMDIEIGKPGLTEESST